MCSGAPYQYVPFGSASSATADKVPNLFGEMPGQFSNMVTFAFVGSVLLRARSNYTDNRYFRYFQNCRLNERPVPPEPKLKGLEIVHVVVSADPTFYEGLMATMLSLAKHLSEPSKCVIHIIAEAAELERLGEVVKCFRRDLTDLDVSPQPKVDLHSMRQPPGGRGSRSHSRLLSLVNPFAHTYVRFYIPDYLPTVRRALWLDTDVIVKADVGPLYRMQMKHPVALAPTPRAFGWHWLRNSLRHHKFRHIYANTSKPPVSPGIILMDLPAWRSERLFRNLERWTLHYNGTHRDFLPFVAEFQQRHDYIDWRWSVCLLGIIERLPDLCRDEAKLLHWSGFCKPFPAQMRRFCTTHRGGEGWQALLKLWDVYAPSPTCQALKRLPPPSPYY